MGPDSDGDDYESLEESLDTLLAVAVATFAETQQNPLLTEDEDSHRLRDVVDARDRRERGRKQTSSREAHKAVFPLAPPTKLHLSAMNVLLRRTRT